MFRLNLAALNLGVRIKSALETLKTRRSQPVQPAQPALPPPVVSLAAPPAVPPAGLVLKVKKLHPDAKIPAYAKPGDAGLDLTAVSSGWDSELKKYCFDTGIAVEIPEGFVGLLFPRSSIVKKALDLSNSVGVVDSGYRGSIKAYFTPQYNKAPDTYEVGDRILQLVVIPYPQVTVQETAELSPSVRGDNGFGSSGQ